MFLYDAREKDYFHTDVRISGGTYLDPDCRNEEELKLRNPYGWR